jgi:hypothetical protein
MNVATPSFSDQELTRFAFAVEQYINWATTLIRLN